MVQRKERHAGLKFLKRFERKVSSVQVSGVGWGRSRYKVIGLMLRGG